MPYGLPFLSCGNFIIYDYIIPLQLLLSLNSKSGLKKDNIVEIKTEILRVYPSHKCSSPLTPKTPGEGTVLFKFTDPALNARAATVKEQLLAWCQSKTAEYEVLSSCLCVSWLKVQRSYRLLIFAKNEHWFYELS